MILSDSYLISQTLPYTAYDVREVDGVASVSPISIVRHSIPDGCNTMSISAVDVNGVQFVGLAHNYYTSAESASDAADFTNNVNAVVSSARLCDDALASWQSTCAAKDVTIAELTNELTDMRTELAVLHQFKADVNLALGFSHNTKFANSYIVTQIRDCVDCAEELATLKQTQLINYFQEGGV